MQDDGDGMAAPGREPFVRETRERRMDYWLSRADRAGNDTGDKIYLCYEATDDISGNVRMSNIYEYTYTKGPETEWVYNPAMLE